MSKQEANKVEKITFRKAYDVVDVKAFSQDLSRKEENLHVIKDVEVNGRKQKVLVDNGKVNIYDRIQEHADSGDVYKIIERVAKGLLNADDLFAPVGTEVVDATKIPTDLLSTQKLIEDTKASFDKVPTELKKVFGNDVNTFTENFSYDKLKKYIDDKVALAIKENKEKTEVKKDE